MQNLFRVIIVLSAILLAVSCARTTAPTAASATNTIKVMTYNTHHCNAPAKPGVIDVDSIAAVIKRENPDIVALQEIDVNTARSGKINQATATASKAGYESFYFAKAIDFDGGGYGVAILSKYRLSKTVTHHLPTDETTGGEPRVLATAEIQLPNGKTLQFACTHLDAQKSDVNRLMQIKEISRLTSASPVPLIIAGDFNATEGSDVINMLDQDFIRTCQQCRPTLDEDGDDIAIDFIAFKPASKFTVASHKVLQDVHASDHYPVVAVLKF